MSDWNESQAYMKEDHRPAGGAEGGLQLGGDRVRRWRWKSGRVTEPVRCKREQWYLVRGRVSASANGATAALQTTFLRDGVRVGEQSVELHPWFPGSDGDEVLGWFLSPDSATHLQVRAPQAGSDALFRRIVLHPVAERDPKCHPLANVPRWSEYSAPFPIEKVYLPRELEALAEVIGAERTEILSRPRSVADLGRRIKQAACVLDPSWVAKWGCGLEGIERLAAESWLIVDLATLADVVTLSGKAVARVVRRAAPQEIMSARVDYADLATRGFALQDVVPYCAVDADGGFRVRVLRATGSWKRYADADGFATLLASETPWEAQCGDVLSCARPLARGELIGTDLPWLLAGRWGAPLAPRVGGKLLRAHLGGAVDDWVQYWNRWDDSRVLLRDIAELPRRYPPLRTVRWASTDQRTAHLGLALGPADGSPVRRRLVIRTGRIDNCDAHDGVPPEPMIIFMKFLAREARERTSWARRVLGGVEVTWQFDTLAGLRYALHYTAADSPPRKPRAVVDVSWSDRSSSGPGGIRVSTKVGVFGDGSHEAQRELSVALRAWIQRSAG